MMTAERPLVRSEQFNPGGLSFPEFAAWFHHNAITNIVEPALLPDFAARLSQSDWLSEAYLSAFQDRQTRVADTMRFAPTRRAAHPPLRPQNSQAERSFEETHQCRFTAVHCDRLGRDFERTYRDPGYRSPYLTHPWARKDTVDMSPLDAAALDIGQGETVRVTSRRGEVHVKAHVTDRVPRGMVWMAFHFREANANWLTNPAFDPVTLTAEYKACAVRVEKA